MKYYTHNQLPVSVESTWKQGSIRCDYYTLVDAFGKPMAEGFDDHKSDAEWRIRWEDGMVAAIYNWKNGWNYLGPAGGIPTTLIGEWSVGGSDPAVVERVKSVLKLDITGSATALPLP